MLKNIKRLIELSSKYNIPTEDLLLLDLNLSGIKLELQSRRVRFELKSINKDIFSLAHSKNIYDFYLALPTVDHSPYFFKDGYLFFDNHLIGKALGITEDYCDASYPRREGTALNLNPNSTTSCKEGCKFCYVAFQVPKDRERMLSSNKLRNFLENWIERFDIPDLSHLIQVAVVTAIFPGEKEVVDFLKMARNVLNEFLFNGELLYFGSQITSKKSIVELEKVKLLKICFSLECFDNKNRNYFLGPVKHSVYPNDIKKIMNYANNMGIRTNFSYIVGLESLETIKKGFCDFLPYINSFPIVNTLQIHKGQEKLEIRHSKAEKIDYYIKARKIIEDIFMKTTLRPRPWENYRSLWYLKFDEEFLTDVRTPLPLEHKLFDEIVASKQHKKT